MSDTLHETFNIDALKDPIVPKVKADLVTSVAHNSEDIEANIDADYETTRANLNTLLEEGHAALSRAIEVAMASEHPTAFEVAFNAMKQLAVINGQLLELSSSRLKLKEETGKDPKPTHVTNNAIFVGTAKELSKAIKEKQEMQEIE